MHAIAFFIAKDYEEWLCGSPGDLFCIAGKVSSPSPHERARRRMGWVFEHSIIDLESDEKCREEIAALVIRCTSLGRAVALTRQVPLAWRLWAFLAGGAFGLLICCKCTFSPGAFRLCALLASGSPLLF